MRTATLFNFKLSTTYQNIRKLQIKKKAHKRTPRLKSCPQVRGVVRRARIATPKKPNSARRPVAKVMLVNGLRVTAHIPGIGHNIRSYTKLLVRGGGARDLPGVRYSCVRGALEFLGVYKKNRRRSVYGVKQPLIKPKKLRRKFRFR